MLNAYIGNWCTDFALSLRYSMMKLFTLFSLYTTAKRCIDQHQIQSIYVYRARDDAIFVREMNKMSYTFDICASLFSLFRSSEWFVWTGKDLLSQWYYHKRIRYFMMIDVALMFTQPLRNLNISCSEPTCRSSAIAYHWTFSVK